MFNFLNICEREDKDLVEGDVSYWKWPYCFMPYTEMIAISIRIGVFCIPVCVLGDLSGHSGSNVLLYFFASSTK